MIRKKKFRHRNVSSFAILRALLSLLPIFVFSRLQIPDSFLRRIFIDVAVLRLACSRR